MTLRDRALPFLSRARSTLIDQHAGLRRYSVYSRVRTFSDSRGGRGAVEQTVDTAWTEKPRVRQANEHDVVASGGKISSGDFVLESITPQNAAATVGVTWDSLGPQPSTTSEERLIVLVGPDMPAYVGRGTPTTPVGTGSSAPALTLSGTCVADWALLEVQATRSGARGTWEGRWRVDGGAWTAFVSAASVTLTGTGLTLAIATGTASIDAAWSSRRYPSGGGEFSVSGGNPTGAFSYRLWLSPRTGRR